MMIRGDLIHIPQDCLLLVQENDKGLQEYVKTKKPTRALFLERDLKEPKWGMIYYKERIWNVRMKDIYPITQEMENAS